MPTNVNSFTDEKNKNVDIFIYSHVPFVPVVENHVYKILTNNHAPDEEFQLFPNEYREIPMPRPTAETIEGDFFMKVPVPNPNGHRNLPIYRDYTGDNISENNLMFNEYAGFYWLLHNWDIKDYIGMVHYRRYFNFLDDVPNIEKIFSYGVKIILNSKFYLRYPMGSSIPKSNREFYKIWHNVDDFDLMGKIVKENYPQYADGWDKMANVDYIYPSSLFIMPKELFKEYVSFAIDVMNKFNDARGCHTPEEWIAYIEAHKDEYVRPQHAYYTVKMQARATGYLVERCLAAFLMAGDDPLVNHAAEYEWSVLGKNAWERPKPKIEPSASTKTNR